MSLLFNIWLVSEYWHAMRCSNDPVFVQDYPSTVVTVFETDDVDFPRPRMWFSLRAFKPRAYWGPSALNSNYATTHIKQLGLVNHY